MDVRFGLHGTEFSAGRPLGCFTSHCKEQQRLKICPAGADSRAESLGLLPSQKNDRTLPRSNSATQIAERGEDYHPR